MRPKQAAEFPRIFPFLLFVFLFMFTVTPLRAGYAGSSNQNSIVYPGTAGGLSGALDVFANPSSTIQGSDSSDNGPLLGCSSAYTYNWDYQANLLQGSELGNSYVQEIVEVDQNGLSCFTAWFFPNINNNGVYDYYSIMIGHSNNLYSAGDTVLLEVDANPSGGTATVTQFLLYIQASNSVYTIEASQLSNNPTILYDSGSKENLVLVGTGGNTNTQFTAGAGSLQYCDWTAPSPPNQELVGTGETSNMGYTALALTNTPCSNPSYSYYSQNFQVCGCSYLTMHPATGVNPLPPNGYYPTGSTVTISATQTCKPGITKGWSFNGWTGTGSGSYSGFNNPATVIMNANIAETASSYYGYCPQMPT